MRHPLLLLALSAFALSGCALDYDLTQGLGSDDGSESTGPGGGDNPDDPPGNNGNNHNNPWGHLIPGEMPEAYFVVAYSETGYSGDPYSYGCYGEQVHYAMIDLRGHVIAEFEVPDSTFTNVYGWYGGHHRFLPAGPGQFVAVTGSSYDYDSDGWDCYYGYGGWGSDWYGWRGDGVTGGTEPVAQGTWTTDGYTTHLIGAERDVVHGQYGSTTAIAMQPETPDDLLLWYSDQTCTPGYEGSIRDLASVNVMDATIPDLLWEPNEFLPSWMLGEGLAIHPFAMHAAVDTDLSVNMAFGTTATQCETGRTERVLAGFTEEVGLSWMASAEDLQWPYDIEYSGLLGGAAMYLPAPTEAGQPFKMVQRGQPVLGLLPEDLLNPRLGPLLDPSGPSFVVVSTNEDATGDDLVFIHGGDQVWTIDGLKFGLDKRVVQIRDIMLLPPVPEE